MCLQVEFYHVWSLGNPCHILSVTEWLVNLKGVYLLAVPKTCVQDCHNHYISVL